MQEAAGVQTSSLAAGNGLVRKPAARRGEVIGICVLLAILVFVVFGQTARFDFVNYDDGWYVYQNHEVTGGLSLGGVVHAFTHKEPSFHGLYSPVVTVSNMVDWEFFGLNAGGYHLTNVALHLGSTILLFLILLQMTEALWRSAFVAAVFGIHPLHVESVAWIAERKDVLSGLFFMLTLGAYLRYVRRPGSVIRYLAVLVPFALGLMCKPMIVTLPLVLLLLDYWPLNRLFVPARNGDNARPIVNWRAIVEKVPLLALTVALCVVTVIDPKQFRSVAPEGEPIPFWTRMCEAPVWLAIYLRQMVWPTGLAIVYTHVEESLRWWPAALALCGSLTLGIFLLRRKHPYLWMGWLWNLAMLVPVIGFFQIARHERADHYNYLPQIGLYLGLTWVAADWAGERRNRRMALGVVAAAGLCALSVAAWRQTGYWRDSITLWNRALDCTRDNFIAYCNLGDALAQKGRTDEAIAQFQAALRIDPDSPGILSNFGNVLFQQGRTDEAVAEYRKALKMNPDSAGAHNNLGNALAKEGRMVEAIGEYREALRLHPGDAETHFNLGNVLAAQGRMEEAIAEFRAALEINPGDAGVHSNLGNALFRQGRTDEAIAQYREALRYNPAGAGIHYNLGKALVQRGQTEEAISQFRAALQINPTNAEAHYDLGNALAREGHMDEAIAEFGEALRINPGSAEAHYNLGNALAAEGRMEEAIAEFRAALQIKPADAKACYNLGNALARQGQTKDAIAEFRAALQIDPTDADAHNNLGKALLQEGQTGEAIVQIQKALDLQPGNVVLQNNLAWMLATVPQTSLRNGTEALELAMKASQSSGGKNPNILRTLAVAYAETGAFSNAAQTAQNALQLAEAESNTALADMLRREIKLYEAGQPFEDTR